MAKMRDSAPGEDEIRLGYIKKAFKEIQDTVVLKVNNMWNTPSEYMGRIFESGGHNPSF